ncbi:MAG: DUF1080 domain-containing protein [Planctomycetota bacterium]|nr:MAG: DUF1080 domain-containing protein [Planctomycetota bacterium]
MKQLGRIAWLWLVCLGISGAAYGEELPTIGIELPKTDEGLPGAGPIRRYDWFQNLWKQRRGQWAQQVEQDQQAVVFLGDSITQGWGENAGGRFPGLKFANRGISGDTTRGMLIRLKSDVLALHPSAVVILMGTNDLEEGAEPETIAANFALIIQALKEHNAKMPIVVCKMFPSSQTKKRPADKIKKTNELFFAAVKGDRQVTVVDTWTLFADPMGDAQPALFPDLLHLNDAGYAAWARSLTPVLATLGFMETEDDKFDLEPGAISLFNGRDLSGWGFRDQKSQDKQESFEGQSASSDGRYVALHGRLVVTTPPEGNRVQQMWTTREFPKNFTLKLEFRATPNADSGVFIRRPQLQCRDYPLAGPYKDLKNYKPQDWNELVVVVKGSVAHCTCNGEVLEAEYKLPESGPIGLEGDRGQMEYRRIRVIEE